MAEILAEDIGLFDLDGSLCDYDGAVRRDLEKIAGPNDPPYVPFSNIGPPYMKERIRIIRNQPGWWRNLERLQIGFDVLEIARELGYRIHILTKGPFSSTSSWSEKAEWVRDNVPDASITITEDKGLVYGKVLVDDFPGYIESWLEHRPRGLVIMPGHSYNEGFSHPQVVRYDSSNLEEVRDAMIRAKLRQPYERL